MKTRTILTGDPGALRAALDVLDTGGLVAFPTDTVYGLGGRAFASASIERIYAAKGRDASKAVPILLGEIAHLSRVALDLPPAAQRLAEHFWPGALTLVVPKNPDLPENLSQTPTVGVRMPDHPFALALLRASGPLAVTSANLSGAENPRTAEDVLSQLDGRIELVLDGGAAPGGVPSTVVDCTGSQIRVLRQGAISAEDILRVAGQD